jgi:hypothetical protein
LYYFSAGLDRIYAFNFQVRVIRVTSAELVVVGVVVDWMGGLRWVYRFVSTIASDCTAAGVVGDLCAPLRVVALL